MFQAPDKSASTGQSEPGPSNNLSKEKVTTPKAPRTTAQKTTMPANPKECPDFDDVIERVGPDGTFQKHLLIFAVSIISAVQPILAYNAVFMLFTPEHWCKGPNREAWDDVEEYKLINIPMKNGTDGIWKYSSCTFIGPYRSEVKCPSGWEYDKTFYRETLTSKNDWVCDQASIPTYALLAGTVGNAFGTLMCGLLSDMWGRKKTLFLVVAFNVTFRVLSLYTTGNWLVFCIVQFFAGLTHTAIYILPSLISAELCGKDDRTKVYATTWTICLFGLAILPFISWLCADWYIIGVSTAGIGGIMLLYYFVIPESPRWLLQKGRVEEAAKVLHKIQTYNFKAADKKSEKSGQKTTPDTEESLRNLLDEVLHAQLKSCSDDNLNQSKASILLTKKNLAKNTLLLTICWSMNTLVYSAMTFNAIHMSGSHFKNFFLLAVIEVPSGFMGGYFADTLGRRWTQVLAFSLCGLSCLATLAITVSFLVVYLQATELFPTELRSSGSGIASTVGNFVGITAPVIAKLSSQNAAYPWFVMTALSLVGATASLFLPETLNIGLPETIEEANNIGKNDKFWSLPSASSSTAELRKK